MAAILNATVGVRVEMSGTGDLTAKATAGGKAVDELKQKVGAAGETATKAKAQTDGFAKSLEGMKESVAPVNKTREVFENLKSNLVTFPLAIGGIIGSIATAIGGAIGWTDKYEEATKKATERAKDFLSALQGLEAITAKYREETTGLTAEEKRVNDIRERQVKNIIAMTEAAAQLDAQQKGLVATNERLAEIFTQIRLRMEQIVRTRGQFVGVGQQEERRQIVQTDELADLIAKQIGYIREVQRAQEGLGAVMKINLDLASQTTGLYTQMASLADRAALGLAGGGKGVRPGDELARLATFRALRGSAAGVKAPSGGGGGADPLLEWQDKMRRLGTPEPDKFTDRDFRMMMRTLDAVNDNEFYSRNTSSTNFSDADSTSGLASIASGKRVGGFMRGGIGALVGDANSMHSAAKGISDFSKALSEALPGMAEFKDSLGQIFGAGADLAAANVQRMIDTVSQLATIWKDWGDKSITTKQAVVGSLGAIATAGAAAIKDERLRAGVLSIIELGLGFANIADPPVAAAHFAASAILGGVAIFGGGSSSGKSGGGSTSAPSRGAQRLQGEMLGQRAVGVTIYGNYYAFGKGDQEAASDVQRLTHRADGTGFERAA